MQNKQYQELHIILDEEASKTDEALYPLRDLCQKNRVDTTNDAHSCAVFIHVPLAGGEHIVKTALRISPLDTTLEAIGRCAGVAQARYA